MVRNQNFHFWQQSYYKMCVFVFQYLACLSTSSSNDKLAFDVGLQAHSQGIRRIVLLCYIIELSCSLNTVLRNKLQIWHSTHLYAKHSQFLREILYTSNYNFVISCLFAGEACWWTVHPASKQRSEGEKIRVGDDLILVSVATERYLVRALTVAVSLSYALQFCLNIFSTQRRSTTCQSWMLPSMLPIGPCSLSELG